MGVVVSVREEVWRVVGQGGGGEGEGEDPDRVRAGEDGETDDRRSQSEQMSITQSSRRVRDCRLK